LLTRIIKDMALSQDQAEMIYKSESGKKTYDYAIKSLLPRENKSHATMVIVRVAEGSALYLAREIRGKSGQSGIRSKYQLYTKKELKEKLQPEDKIKMALAENRLHVPDTDDEAMEIINALTTRHEKDELEEHEPELYIEMRRNIYLEKQTKLRRGVIK